MQQLVEPELLGVAGRAIQGGNVKAPLEMVKLFHWFDTAHRQVNLAALQTITELTHLLIGKFRFQITLTIKCGCLDERLTLLMFDLEKHAISGDLFAVINLDNVTNFYVS